jgi:hypothetical protein
MIKYVALKVMKKYGVITEATSRIIFLLHISYSPRHAFDMNSNFLD